MDPEARRRGDIYDQAEVYYEAGGDNPQGDSAEVAEENTQARFELIMMS